MKVSSVNSTTNALANNNSKKASNNVQFGAKLIIQPIVKEYIVSSLEKNAKNIGNPVDTPKFTKIAEKFLNGISKRIDKLEPKSQEIVLDIKTQTKRNMNESMKEFNLYNEPARLSLKGSNPEKYLKDNLDSLLPFQVNADSIVSAAERLLTTFAK